MTTEWLSRDTVTSTGAYHYDGCVSIFRCISEYMVRRFLKTLCNIVLGKCFKKPGDRNHLFNLHENDLHCS